MKFVLLLQSALQSSDPSYVAGAPAGRPVREMDLADDASPPDGALVFATREERAAAVASANASPEVAAWHAAQDLARAKAEKLETIDARTGALIDAGFIYGGNVFSLSAEAQLNIDHLALALAMGLLPSEISKATIDNSAIITIALADLPAFISASKAVLFGVLQAGNALKARVLAASTQADLDAIVDGR